MPYDPAPTGPDALGPDGRRLTLTVQLEGGAGEPETVLVLERPTHADVGDTPDARQDAPRDDGAARWVRVREQPAPGAPRTYQATCAELLGRVERVARAGRRVRPELHLVRAFLAGHA